MINFLMKVAQQYITSNRLLRLHIPYNDFTAFMALQGSLNAVEYLIQRGYPCTNKTTLCAAYNGSVDLLKYLQESVKCQWSKYTCDMAAKSKNLAALQYVRSIGCPWTEHTCAEAATNSLACLKYAHENGATWYSGTTCSNAAQFNQLDCLIYAHDRGGKCY